MKKLAFDGMQLNNTNEFSRPQDIFTRNHIFNILQMQIQFSLEYERKEFFLNEFMLNNINIYNSINNNTSISNTMTTTIESIRSDWLDTSSLALIVHHEGKKSSTLLIISLLVCH